MTFKNIIGGAVALLLVVCLPVSGAKKKTSHLRRSLQRQLQRDFDPILNANFRVEIDGVALDPNRFAVVGGFESQIEVIEYKNGDDPILRKRPGRVKYGNITLKRYYNGDKSLWDWYKSFAVDGLEDRRSGSVILLGRDGSTEVERYNFYEAWPMRYKNYELEGISRHDFGAMGGNNKKHKVLVEEIELAVEWFEAAE